MSLICLNMFIQFKLEKVYIHPYKQTKIPNASFIKQTKKHGHIKTFLGLIYLWIIFTPYMIIFPWKNIFISYKGICEIPGPRPHLGISYIRCFYFLIKMHFLKVKSLKKKSNFLPPFSSGYLLKPTYIF